MTAIPDNIKITKDSAQIIMGTNRVTENWTKILKLIGPPTTSANWDIDIGAKDVMIVDILRQPEHRFTFDGYISNSLTNRSAEGSKNSAGVAITDATDILDTMRKIFYAGGVFTINWAGTEYLVNCDKFESRWATNDKDTITSYDVKFTVIVGVDL